MSDKKKNEELEQETESTVPQAEQMEEQDSSQQPKETQAPEPPEKTEKQLLEEQIADLNNKLLRTLAEYDNFRKRSQREKDALAPITTASVLAQFLPVVDIVERALAAECSDGEYKKGVEMILTSFKETFSRLGAEEFGEAGEQFDPNLHNAVMHVEDEALQANTITEVFQKGYKLGERIIRHAMVKVAN